MALAPEHFDSRFSLSQLAFPRGLGSLAHGPGGPAGRFQPQISGSSLERGLVAWSTQVKKQITAAAVPVRPGDGAESDFFRKPVFPS